MADHIPENESLLTTSLPAICADGDSLHLSRSVAPGAWMFQINLGLDISPYQSNTVLGDKILFDSRNTLEKKKKKKK